MIEANINNPEYLIEKEKVKVVKTKWHEKVKPEKEDTATEPSAHDAIIESLITIGQIFGYETLKKPLVNDLRPPDKPFKSKEKALDLAWKIFGLAYVPFEVQVYGSIPDLIYRFNLVHPWSLKMVGVAEEELKDYIEEHNEGQKLTMEIIPLKILNYFIERAARVPSRHAAPNMIHIKSHSKGEGKTWEMIVNVEFTREIRE